MSLTEEGAQDEYVFAAVGESFDAKVEVFQKSFDGIVFLLAENPPVEGEIGELV